MESGLNKQFGYGQRASVKVSLVVTQIQGFSKYSVNLEWKRYLLRQACHFVG